VETKTAKFNGIKSQAQPTVLLIPNVPMSFLLVMKANKNMIKIIISNRWKV
jgi:hypothetical protein